MLVTSNALAFDSFQSTRSDLLVERRHQAVLTLSPDHAELVVQRTFYNGASVSDQATVYIELPPRGVATRMRTRGIGPSAPWFEGELLEAEEAARRYRELTGLGGYYPKDPALLSWRSQGLLALQVFPCPPRAEKLVEYRVELPTSYEEGELRVQLPRLGTESMPARIQLVARDRTHALRVDGKAFKNGGTLPTPTNEYLSIGLRVPLPLLSSELVSIPFGPRRVLTRYAINAAPQLSRLPAKAHVVIVVDASRSVGDSFEGSARQAIDGYLSHLPDARVEILTFDRQVKHELGAFQAVGVARTALRSLTLQRKNGSDVDLALFRADQLLALAPSTSPRRVLVLTDGKTRQSLTPERLRGALATSGALVHIGLLETGAPRLSRLDEHVWASAVRPSGGLVWSAAAPTNVPGDAEDDLALRSTYEEWARPLRVDRLSVYSDNQSLMDSWLERTLVEGQGFAALWLDGNATRNLSVSGELWSTIVRTQAQPDPTRERLESALVFGSEALSQLSEPEMMTLAVKGGAVSPVTSYLAIEPGVRPSTEGLSHVEQGWGFGRAPKVRMGGTRHGGRAPQLDRREFLERQLRPELSRCGGSSAVIDLETTSDEIVAVVASADPVDPMVESCLAEATWALLLPPGFDEPWQSFRVEL